MEQSLLADVFNAHVRHDFVEQDVDATMQTMTAEPYLLYLPTLPGGERRQAVRRFYEQLFVGKWPADSKVVRLSGIDARGGQRESEVRDVLAVADLPRTTLFGKLGQVARRPVELCGIGGIGWNWHDANWQMTSLNARNQFNIHRPYPP